MRCVAWAAAADGVRLRTSQDRLDDITAQTRNLVQPERLALGERAVAELFASGVEDNLLKPGDTMPAFTLPDADGKTVRSADLLALGPLVISFFRGRWCPYCVTELETWRDRFPSVRERGALLVAISPQTVRQNDFTASQHMLPFPLLRDEGAAVAAQFGAAYPVPAYMQSYYRSILVNIPFVNGEPSWRLPIPATFVVDQDRVIAWSQGHADFRVRPEPLEALKALGH
jgi:peroxiredoxin